MPEPEDSITQLLADWKNGDRAAFDRLVPIVQRSLTRIARNYLAHERSDHTLQSTALVNEAYIRLMNGQQSWKDRAHFYSAAAQAMRYVLVDYARTKRREKRGGGVVRVCLEDEDFATPAHLDEIISIHQALEALAAIDARKCRVVEMRLFAGLDVEETALVLGVAPNTVIRDWSFARAWLRTKLRTKEAE